MTQTRHERLRDRLTSLGFIQICPTYGEPAETWMLGYLTVILPTDTAVPDYNEDCDQVEAIITPLEYTYLRGRQQEAKEAQTRVWLMQDDFDANDAYSHPESRTRYAMDLLEEAAWKAGGPHAVAGHMNAGVGTARCGCAVCVDQDAGRKREAGAPFSLALGTMGMMVLCEICGNKRCPHATWHENACTGSNEPGQAGSRYA